MAERAPGGFAAVYRVLATFEETRALPPRLLRRGSRRRAVRAARRGRPAARGGALRSSEPARTRRVRRRRRRRARWCSRRPTRRTRSAPRCRGRPEAPARTPATSPGRKAGALVVLVDGGWSLYVERGGRTLLTWAEDPAPAAARGRRAVARGPRGPARPPHGRAGRRRRRPGLAAGAGAGGGGLPCDPARAETAQVTADDGDGRRADDWAARRGDAAAEQAARLARQRGAEADEARLLLADFVRQARDRGIAPVALRARAINGRTLYKTGLTGWYLQPQRRRSGSTRRASSTSCPPRPAWPPGCAAPTVAPSDPPLVAGVGGRDGESMPLARPAAAAAGGRVGLDRPVTLHQLGRQHHLRRRAGAPARHPSTSCRRWSPPATGSARWAAGTRSAASPTPTATSSRVAGLPPTVEVVDGPRDGDRRRRDALRRGGGARCRRTGLALHNLGSLPHISVAGAVATGTHGSGADPRQPGRPRWSALELVTADGDAACALDRDATPTVPRRGRRAGCARCRHRGHAGGRADVRRARRSSTSDLPVRRLRHRPRRDPRRRLQRQPVHRPGARRRRPGLGEAAHRRRRAPALDRAGSTAARRPGRCTRCPACRRRAAPSSSACPGRGTSGCRTSGSIHTPSSGAELQTEYLVPRAARGRRRSTRVHGDRGDRIAPVLQVSELRTVAADDLWLSPAYRQDSAGRPLHLGRRHRAPCCRWSPSSRSALAPFGARPHWGKVFTMPPAAPCAALPAAGRRSRRCAESWTPTTCSATRWWTSTWASALELYSTGWLNTGWHREGAPMEGGHTRRATFAALGDPVRQRMVELLADGDATGHELAASFPISLQAVSRHIKVLEARRCRVPAQGGADAARAPRGRLPGPLRRLARGAPTPSRVDATQRLDELLEEMKERPT